MARLLLTVFILIGVLAVATGSFGTPRQPRFVTCKRIEKKWNKCKAQGKGNFGSYRSTDEKCKKIGEKMVQMCGHTTATTATPSYTTWSR